MEKEEAATYEEALEGLQKQQQKQMDDLYDKHSEQAKAEKERLWLELRMDEKFEAIENLERQLHDAKWWQRLLGLTHPIQQRYERLQDELEWGNLEISNRIWEMGDEMQINVACLYEHHYCDSLMLQRDFEKANLPPEEKDSSPHPDPALKNKNFKR